MKILSRALRKAAKKSCNPKIFRLLDYSDFYSGFVKGTIK
jgi:hypothetical protein